MKARDKKAVENLYKHKNKLVTPVNFDLAWVSKLSDMLLKYLGSDSQLFMSANSWYSFATPGNISNMNDCVKILENSIEFIEDNGVVANHSIWRVIENSNKTVVTTITIFLISIIFWSGYYVGINTSINSNYQILIQNEKLYDSINSLNKILKPVVKIETDSIN